MSAAFIGNLSGILHLGRYNLEVTSRVQDSFHNMVFEAHIPEISLTALAGDILRLLQAEMPVCPPEIDLRDVGLRINPSTLAFQLLASLNLTIAGVPQSGRAFFITTAADDQKRGYLFGLQGLELNLQNLPVVGDQIKGAIRISDGMIIGSSAQFTNPPLPFGPAEPDSQLVLYPGLAFRAKLVCMDYTHTLDLFPEPDAEREVLKALPLREEPAAPPAVKKSGGIQKWFDIQKTLGPLELRRVGIELNGQIIRCLLEAEITVSGLRITLDGLGVSTSLAKLTDLQFVLQGMGISFTGGPVEISGSFIKVADERYDMYQGSALVKINTFSLLAIGSYAVPKHPVPGEDQTSLFLFGMVNAPIGGPPCLYVKGLALGFGYNRNLVMPALNDIRRFPLLAGVLGEGGISSRSKPEEVLQAVNTYLSPAAGQYWLAAGLKFSSFETIDVFGMCCVSFGAVFEINVLALGVIRVPTHVANPAFQAELAIIVRFAPANGMVGVDGALTSASYILSKDCHITGGFAFYLWFAGEHKGDFVVSLGGYHRDFAKPAHYPTPDRLGLSWQISDHLQVSGKGYFALTPSCLMAGGDLEMSFHAGQLHAGFTANVHLLMSWKPFHYDVSIGVNISVSYTVKLWRVHKTFSTHLDASIHLWGPEFSGKAQVHWTVISFTIAFGQGADQDAPAIDWPEFSASFLPKAEALQGANGNPADICTIRAERGLTAERTDQGIRHWLVQADALILVTHAAVPVTSVQFNQSSIPLQGMTTQLGVLPMGAGRLLSSNHRILLHKQNPGGEWEAVPPDGWLCEVQTENVPEALWGLEKVNRPAARILANVPVGMAVRPRPVRDYHQLPALDLCRVGFNSVPRQYAWIPPQPPETGSLAGEGIDCVEQTVMNPRQVTTRNAVLQILQRKGYGDGAAASLEKLAESARAIFTGQPELVDLTGVTSASGDGKESSHAF